MKIEKTIKQLIVSNSEEKINDDKLIKVEVRSSKISKANIKVKYKIVVTNTGAIAGTALVQDTVPQGYKIADENPSYWNKTSDGNLETTTETIQPGESKELEVVLVWQNSKDNFGEKVNVAQIMQTNNISKAEETTLEDNKSQASVMMNVRTGLSSEYIVLIPIILLSVTMLVIGIIAIKKYVLTP